jgi:hypothetical protein
MNNERKKIVEFLFFLILFLACIGAYFYKTGLNRTAEHMEIPPPVPEVIETLPPSTAETQKDNENAEFEELGENPPLNTGEPLLPQNIPYWELD